MNVVMLLADDMRFDAMGCVGNPIVRTPHLNALSEAGITFRNHFVTTAICPISRVSILTGQYARRHKIIDFEAPMTEPLLNMSYVRLLRPTHRTGFIGKWGIGSTPINREFDYWDGFLDQGRYHEKPDRSDEHLTERQTRSAVSFIENVTRRNDPFCLSISYKSPHAQDEAKPEFQFSRQESDHYRNVTLPRPATATEEHFSRLPEFLRDSEARIRWNRRFATEEMFQTTVRNYYRLVSGLDTSIGAIIGALSRTDNLENTLIVFTSDNGFMFGEHGLSEKYWMYESSIRTPMIISALSRQQSRKPSRHVYDFSLNIDVNPTILDFCGVRIPAEVQGVSLRPIIEGRQAQLRGEFYYEHFFKHPRIPETEGVRHGDWKYIEFPEKAGRGRMLFDLTNDPQEETNLAEDSQFTQKLLDMKDRLERLRQAAG